MPVQTAETILAGLKRVPLLTPSQLQRVEEAAGRGAHTPEKVVGRLVEKGWVTKFQGDTLLAGKAELLVVGPYLLLDQLGEGGMGRVYKARHLRLGRLDAVKVIRADKLASKTLARRFAREIRLTAILEHPHIVRALDAGEVGGRLYLATELIDGEDLASAVVRSGPLSPADACLAAYQACLALQCIHERGLVHRDVKPSNLMRERATRTVKLMDLGLSGVRAGGVGASLASGALTADGVMLGTPDFMSPEQARDPHGADIRTDIYGLGSTLFFLLTGRPPYLGSTVERLLAHASAPVPPIVTPVGPAPPALAAVVARLMAKRPADRYPTPAAVAEALLALRPGARPVEVIAPAAADDTPAFADTPPPGPAPVEAWQTQFEELIDQAASHSIPAARPRPRPRRPWWLVPAVGGVLTAAILVATALGGRSRPPTAAPPTPLAAMPPTPAEELRVLREALKGTEDREAVRRRVIDFRARHIGTPHATAAAALLRRLPSPLDQLKITDGSGYARVTGDGSTPGALAFSADESRLVFTHSGQAPEEVAIPDLTPTPRFPAGDLGKRPAAVTPDGRVAAGADADGRLVVWGAGGVRAVEIPGLKAGVVGLAADGRTAVVVPADPSDFLVRVELQGGKVLGRLEVRAVGVRDVTLAADGGACLLSCDDGAARVVPLPAGQVVRTIEPVPGAPGPPVGAFAPDGGRLYLAGIERAAGRYQSGANRSDVSYELPGERPAGLWRLVSPTPRVTAVAVSADETAVAVGYGTGRVMVFVAVTGRSTFDLTFHVAVRSLAFAPSGKALAAGLDGGRVVLIPLGK